MEIKNYFAQDAQGNIMPSANCYLYLPGTTTLATGLVDGNGAPISNPFLASNIGQVTFGAPNGVYDLRISQGARDTTIEIQCADLLQALNETASFLGAKSSAPTTRNDGSALQIADRYFNTADQLEYLYKSTGWVANNLDGQLLATSRGASLLGALMQDGSPGTIQEAIDEGDNSLRQDLASPTGAAIVSYQQTGTGSTPRNLGEFASEWVTPGDFGAKMGDPTNNVSLAIQKALAAGHKVYIPAGVWYGGPASAADESLVIMLKPGDVVEFDPAAYIRFKQNAGTYLPVFAGVKQGGWKLTRPQFIWDGQVIITADGDIRTATVEESSPSVSRMGTGFAYRVDIYNCAIFAAECGPFEITDFKIVGVSPDRPILNGISTVRTTGVYVIDGIDVNDVNIGVMAQGGEAARYTRAKAGRLNNDIGIPGHTIYSFVTDVTIDGVIDSGVETGASRASSHTLSWKGNGSLIYTNINSKRGEGPLNFGTAPGSTADIVVSNLVWDDSGAGDAGTVSAIYNSGEAETNKSSISFDNVTLKTSRDRPLLGGSMNDASGSIRLIRKDTSAPVTAYMHGRFVECDLIILMRQRGAFDAKVLRMQSGGAQSLAGNRLTMPLKGFNTTPSFDYVDSDGRWQGNDLIFKLPRLNQDGTANTSRSLGNPDLMFPGQSIFTKSQNYVGVTDDSVMWDRTYAAGVSAIDANFPISIGTYTVEVLISANAGAWKRLYRYQVASARPDGVGGYVNSVQQIGVVSAVGASFLSADPVVVVPSIAPDGPGNIKVTATVTNAGALALPVKVFLSASKVGR